MSNIRVYARFPHPATGETTREKVLRQRVFAIKNHSAMVIGKKVMWPEDWLAADVAARAPRLFEGDPVLVPVPSSRVTPADTQWDGEWPSHRLVAALLEHGVGSQAAHVIRRTTPMRSAKMSRRNQEPRPTIAEHLETLEIRGELPDGPRIVLVDDVLTRGTQFAACVELLRGAGYRGRVRGFAAAYWTRDTDDIERDYEGSVSWEDHERADRNP